MNLIKNVENSLKKRVSHCEYKKSGRKVNIYLERKMLRATPESLAMRRHVMEGMSEWMGQ